MRLSMRGRPLAVAMVGDASSIAHLRRWSTYGTVTACTGVAGLVPHAFSACTLML